MKDNTLKIDWPHVSIYLTAMIKRIKPYPEAVIGILNGGAYVASSVAGHFGIPLDFMKIKSYTDMSKGKNHIWAVPVMNIKDKNIVLVDDIYDTGETLEIAVNHLSNPGTDNIPRHIIKAVLTTKNTNSNIPHLVWGTAVDKDSWVEFPWEGSAY